MQLNDWQKAVLKDYANGTHAHLIEVPDVDILDIPDLLLVFILKELSENQNCKTVDEGITRLCQAHADLGVALAACVALQSAINKKLDSGAKLFD